MREPIKVASIVDAMLAPCTYCKALPMQPCRTPGTRSTLRFTHAERNRS